MRLSSFWLSTQKETPAEAEVVSHQLMLRAGMIRQTAVGVYSWLPLGLRVLKKVEAIVREEMNRAGALEVFMPMVQPNELWRESKRWQDYGPELLRFLDRHEREYCLGPTHEEVVTDLMRRDLTSYKQLPLNVYQIQTKFRDEIRPRFGVMRGREFLMKDGYSFHLDEACLQQTYEAMYQAYCRIFERIGLDYRAVLADNGSIGGTGSHEFHVLAQTGEDDIVFSQDGSYAANMEKAQAYIAPVECADAGVEKVKFATPECGSIEQLCAQYDVDAMQSVKTLLVKGAQEGQLVALVLRGGDSLNEVKAEHLDVVASPLVFADEAEVRAVVGAGFGSLGPFELGLPLVVDYEAARLADFVAGANEDGFHYKHLNMARDVPEAMVADIRNVIEGDLSPQTRSPLLIKRGIEVGHIFQLGVKYSQSMGLKVPLEDGGSTTPLMGCYGIGVSRIVAAAIEQNHDARGIIFPQAIAPFSVAILPLNAHKSAEVAEAAEKLYAQLLDCGVEVALDDRGKRAGVMFADMDLIGVPMRVVISDKTLAQGAVEFKLRREEEAQLVALSEVVAQIKALI